MAKRRKNTFGLQARFVDHIIEVWLDNPNPAYKGLLFSFDKAYIGSVQDLLNNLHKIPKFTQEEIENKYNGNITSSGESSTK